MGKTLEQGRRPKKIRIVYVLSKDGKLMAVSTDKNTAEAIHIQHGYMLGSMTRTDFKKIYKWSPLLMSWSRRQMYKGHHTPGDTLVVRDG